jgi:hypothetical protein
MRRAARIDANQPAIVADLRKAGCTVQILSAVGHGCPDILVGYHLRNYLFEIKDPAQPPSKQKLTPDEQLFKETWRGQTNVITTAQDALYLMRQT